MSKILFLFPDEAMISTAQDTLKPFAPAIDFAVTDIPTAVTLVKSRAEQGLEVVAARPLMATAIQRAKINIAVVTIPITSFDIIRAINDARLHGKRIAVAAHSAMVIGIDFLAEVLGVEIRHYNATLGQDYEKLILQAVSEGAEVILGGFQAMTAANRRGIPCALLKIGREGLLQAAQEALQIQQALVIESVKRSFLNTIVESSRDGIITVDREQNITAFNPAAQKMLRTSKAKALGKPLATVLPMVLPSNDKSQGKEIPDTIMNVNGNKILCDSMPIVVHNSTFGSVTTLQDVTKIQQMEAMIRKEIYARGLVAKFQFKDILGKSPAITCAIDMAKDCARTDSSVLILGRTGTGKEVFAQSIHNASKRSTGPFVAVNCASLPAQLLESELFGYVAGAFTGAIKEGKPGLFEVAHGGTIFLDEIGEMDYANQGRLLRVLQEKSVVRLGSYTVIPVDVRIIAATNKNLEELVAGNKFRDDLYYRLDVLRLELPPLRERTSDIPLFAERFLHEFSLDSGRNFRLTKTAVKLLEKYSWPGNVRECGNIMERIAATAKSDVIDGTVLAKALKTNPPATPSSSGKEDRQAHEIVQALAATRDNYTAAAKMLGINRTTLYRRMRRFNMPI